MGCGGSVFGYSLESSSEQTLPKAGICVGFKGGIWKVCLNFGFGVPG